jgi:hypothetical protein
MVLSSLSTVMYYSYCKSVGCGRRSQKVSGGRCKYCTYSIDCAYRRDLMKLKKYAYVSGVQYTCRGGGLDYGGGNHCGIYGTHFHYDFLNSLYFQQWLHVTISGFSFKQFKRHHNTILTRLVSWISFGCLPVNDVDEK